MGQLDLKGRGRPFGRVRLYRSTEGTRDGSTFGGRRALESPLKLAWVTHNVRRVRATLNRVRVRHFFHADDTVGFHLSFHESGKYDAVVQFSIVPLNNLF